VWRWQPSGVLSGVTIIISLMVEAESSSEISVRCEATRRSILKGYNLNIRCCDHITFYKLYRVIYNWSDLTNRGLYTKFISLVLSQQTLQIIPEIILSILIHIFRLLSFIHGNYVTVSITKVRNVCEQFQSNVIGVFHAERWCTRTKT
jgi:hypothetical protein